MAPYVDGICDGSTIHTVPCHCGGEGISAAKYEGIECEVISGAAHERVLVIFLFLYDITIILISTYWLITFWRSQRRREYRYYLKVRSPFYLLLSYSMILLFILEEGVASIYLFWSNPADPPRDQKWDGVNWWTHYDGTPIYFGRTGDLLLHFLFWFGVWAFFQLKVFKFGPAPFLCTLRGTAFLVAID